jgi:hypothetical protein
MSAATLQRLVRDIQFAGRITPDDVRQMRGMVYGEIAVTPDEVKQLFGLAGANLESCEEWRIFFVEALSDYLIGQVEPRGYLSEGNADWLMSAIRRDGSTPSALELELIVSLLEKSRQSPAELAAFALACVRDRVLSAPAGEKPHVNADEVALIRRVLHAPGGGGRIFVDRAEANLLFEINDATLSGVNDRGWCDLFVKAIGNHVLGAGMAPAPSVEDLKRVQGWLNDTSVSPGRFLGKGLGGFWNILRQGTAPSSEPAASCEDDIDASEAAWLRARLAAVPGDPNRLALLAFIQENAATGQEHLAGLSRRA